MAGLIIFTGIKLLCASSTSYVKLAQLEENMTPVDAHSAQLGVDARTERHGSAPRLRGGDLGEYKRFAHNESAPTPLTAAEGPASPPLYLRFLTLSFYSFYWTFLLLCLRLPQADN